MSISDSHPSPLAGLKVLDFSRVLAGPFAGRMLCDLGADVVKVEPPEGDVTRLWGKTIGNVPGDDHQQNGGKRDVCLDLRHPGGIEIARALAREADILIENFRPHVMPKLGLGYGDLSKVNPRLVMLSITGFGQQGPQAHRAVYASVIHAEAGLLARGARGSPTGELQQLPLNVADSTAGLHGLIATLAAVILRERTGTGQHIDISMMDAMMITDDFLNFELETSEATRPGSAEVWQCGAGTVLIALEFRFLWWLLRDRLSVPDPATPDMPDEVATALRRDATAAFLMRLDSWESLEQAMKAINVAWGEVNNGRTLRSHPAVLARGAIVEIDDRAGGTRPTTQSPYRFSAATSKVRGFAPHRGEHNAEVLSEWLGKGQQAIDALVDDGVLCSA